ncbi:extracellular solute-binding protein [Paenibacillus sp. IB182496]|uniref:Extracellular solute-binding protein n=1 Tax=Paenibacillus sabuli TaxID=2772509 RepID=A0A927BY74_9BACL|nr:extracellular solute-binding protein [Paenibacillus sabuli]MBD2847795.1 extracellular solute-binding protein [Paenibacillus sabuli]
MRKKGWLIGTIAGLSLLGVVGCSSSETPQDVNQHPGQGAGSSGNEAAEPYEISLMFHYDVEPPKNNSEVAKIIEDYTNTKLDLQSVPSSTRAEKFNVTVASDNLPTAVKAFYETPVVNAIKNGLFWEIGPYLDDYPNLSSINPLVYDNLKVDGKIYGIPSVRDLARNTIVYRKDWLDKLGLSEPKTVDDFYDMLHAFATQDPDGNGQDDTYGLIENDSLFNMDLITAYFGAPNQWGVENGQLVPSFTTDAYLEALQFYRQLYDEGLINQDFPITSRDLWFNIWNSGKAGAMRQITGNGLLRQQDAQKVDPEAEVGMVSLLEGPRGTMIYSERGSNGFFLISKSAVETEEELKRVLTFFDQLMDKEMADLFNWGIEGRTYTIEDEKARYVEGDAYTKLIQPYNQIAVGDYVNNSTPGALHPLHQRGVEMNVENEQAAVANPALTLDSPTNNEKGAQLTKIIEDARIKFILGDIDEAGWADAIKNWKRNGGQDIMEEFTAAYEQNQS